MNFLGLICLILYLWSDDEMRMYRRCSAIAALVLVSCSPDAVSLASVVQEPSLTPAQTIQVTHTEPAESVINPTVSEIPSVPDLRIHVTTTSDWTVFELVEGAVLEDVEIVSSSTSASLDQDRFLLSQSISQAEAGESVELEADLYLREDSLEEHLEFMIDRGHMGSTTVELYQYACGYASLAETFVWDGIQPSGDNVQRFSMPSDLLYTPSRNEYIVIAQLNFWYYGPGLYGGFENDLGGRITPLTPLLGETYAAGDPAVVHQQIEWAAAYGVDAFSIEWTTPRGVGCCGSMEDTLDDVFLMADNIHKVRWAIFYDFVLRLNQTSGYEQYTASLDFDQQKVHDIFVFDFRRFANKYFDHPQYLTIDGRPVIYIWATNAFVGDLEGAILDARQAVAELGFDVFIVGDEVVANAFNPNHAALFDGSSTFTFLIPGLNRNSWSDVGDAAIAVDRTFEKWRANIAGLKVIGREEYVNFQPAWAPQYNDRFFVFDRSIYVPANSKSQVIAMAEVARKHAQPVGNLEQKLIWLNTWNNWAETTTVEPTADLGPKYPSGNYQFDMLEVVREVFGSETFACGVP